MLEAKTQQITHGISEHPGEFTTVFCGGMRGLDFACTRTREQ